jgi:hypothetical protein
MNLMDFKVVTVINTAGVTKLHASTQAGSLLQSGRRRLVKLRKGDLKAYQQGCMDNITVVKQVVMPPAHTPNLVKCPS